MNTRLIIDGNAVYEIDEDCLACRGRRTGCRRCVEPGSRTRGRSTPLQKMETASEKSQTHKKRKMWYNVKKEIPLIPDCPATSS